MLRRTCLVVPLLALAAGAQTVSFNKDVRPIISDRCYTCHGPDSAARKSKLRLDREEDSRLGIVPGSPDKSEVYQRIVSTNKVKRMPPAYMGHQQLPQRDIDTLRRWIEQGAKYEPHWSLIPPRRPVTRAGEDPIDALVRARLQREGLSPSSEADRRTLIRRVTLDLTGLPPTPAEVDAFLADASPAAYEKVVDRLLASPRYAERMTIRWLEAARYADTNGYQSDGPRDMWRWRDWVLDAFNTNMPFDRFTIEQIAGDLLPNATLSQKIATGFHRNHSTSAEGGIVDEEFRVQYVADRAETTSTVWLGLTTGCARCHDHKYDPIKQKDFYQLYAFFNNVPERGFVYNFGNEEPYIKAPLPEQQTKLDDFDRRIAAARARVTQLEPSALAAQAKWEKRAPKLTEEWTITDGLQLRASQLESFDGERLVDFGNQSAQFSFHDAYTFAAWIKPVSGDGAVMSRGEDYFEGQGHFVHLVKGKLRFHATYRWTDLAMRLETVEPVKLNEWQHVAVTYDGSMKASHVRVYINGVEQKVNILFDQPIWPFDTKEPFRIGAGGGKRFTGDICDVRIYTRELTGDEVGVVALVTDKARTDRLRMWFLESYAPSDVRQARAQLASLEADRAKFLKTVPTVMVMKERDTPRTTYLLKRGAYDAPGDEVQPAVPAVLPQLKDGSQRNRLGLAQWLVSRENPLTARVTVNRYWQMLFGTGLVKTVEDFGSQGEWPMHPELLDWLAVEFMDSGWNVKHILKTIVTSATYKQSSNVSPALLQRDPENRLLARGPRTRLPAEMVRDQALFVSGLLVEKLGGPSVKPYQPPGLWQELFGGKGYEQDKGDGLWRRSLYTYWKRTVAPPNMINFDSPTREVCLVRETRTNTPLQALTLMNDVVYVESARKLGERVFKSSSDDAGRLEKAFQLVLDRSPKPAESAAFVKVLRQFQSYYQSHVEDAQKYLKTGESPRDATISEPELAAWAAVSSLLLNLDETVTKE